MSRPKVMMMDEPSLGLAPLVVCGNFRIIEEVNKKGVTILLIEQNANMALKTANTGYVLETGRITMTGSGQELLTNEAVKAAYIWVPESYRHPKVRRNFWRTFFNSIGFLFERNELFSVNSLK